MMSEEQAEYKLSTREQQFLDCWRLYGIPDSDPIPQYKTEEIRSAKSNRVYKWDFGWPKIRLLIEIQGMGFHHSVPGVQADAAKVRAALAAGWVVIPITTQCLKTIDGRRDVCEQIEAIINQRWSVTTA